jgi:hypothetical protein
MSSKPSFDIFTDAGATTQCQSTVSIKKQSDVTPVCCSAEFAAAPRSEWFSALLRIHHPFPILKTARAIISRPV